MTVMSHVVEHMREMLVHHSHKYVTNEDISLCSDTGFSATCGILIEKAARQCLDPRFFMLSANLKSEC